MKKLLCILLGCLCALSVQAAGGEWLERLRQAVQALGDYEVLFDLAAPDGYAASGSCRVSGERYRITLPGVSVYGDGTARYEVNEADREVVVDAVQARSNNLLDNPVRAFDFVGEQYAVQAVAETAAQITLRLTPREADAAAVVELTLDKASALPLAVVYGAEDMQITVKINSFKKSATPFPLFRRSDFPDYEWVDFR